MKILPSYQHLNKHYYNWLIYEIGDQYIQMSAPHIKGTLYDFGCGEKPYEEYFKKYCADYIGVDWASSQHQTKADIIADLNKELPIKSEIADTIISLSVLEHLSEPNTMLNEAYRILKKDGTLIISVPFMWHVHEAPHDYYRFTEFGLRHILEKSNFKNIQIYACTKFWTTWFIKLNYQLVSKIKGNKIKKIILGMIIKPMTYLHQIIAKILDKLWYSEEETQSYWVIAKK